MNNLPALIEFLELVVVVSPLVLTVVLGVSMLLGLRLAEQTTTRLVGCTTVCGLSAALAVLAFMLASDQRHVSIALGDWVVTSGYHFSVKFVFDRLSVPFAILSYMLSGTIGAFASRYLHREHGFGRFFLLYAIFTLGMILASLAGTVEILFTGWELVGLSSALLVAFYQQRAAPPRNGLWIWIVYRVSDAALLLAAVVMHHLIGEGDLDQFLGRGLWPDVASTIPPRDALLVGSLLVFAAAGKSGLVPFSGWLPRSMEGPTPSSAVFYGALSVHLGAFLLLRVSPLLERSVVLCAVIVVLGLATALVAYLAGSVQTDIKSALSFASLSQVGIIVAEIGLGLRYIALVHLLGHACLRTLQFVRAPSLLHDYRTLENAMGRQLPHAPVPWGGLFGDRHAWIYLWALERGYLDALLLDYVVIPFTRIFRWFDGLERRWTDFLAGQASRESDKITPHFVVTIEELT